MYSLWGQPSCSPPPEGQLCSIFPHPSVPTLSPTSSLSHFSPPHPFPRGKQDTQLSQTECAQRDKNTNAITTANIHCIYPYVTQSRLVGCIMFSTCPLFRPFVRLLPTWERYTSKSNEPISMQIGTNPPQGKDLNGRPRKQRCAWEWDSQWERESHGNPMGMGIKHRIGNGNGKPPQWEWKLPTLP